MAAVKTTLTYTIALLLLAGCSDDSRSGLKDNEDPSQSDDGDSQADGDPSDGADQSGDGDGDGDGNPDAADQSGDGDGDGDGNPDGSGDGDGGDGDGEGGDGDGDGDGDGGDTIRFIVMGDGGTGDASQHKVAAAIKQVCAARGCSFALYAGDNIYSSGAASVNDPLFDSAFEEPYAELEFPFYMALGNHDYGNLGSNILILNDDRADAQVAYTGHSQKWMMPDYMYSFDEGPASFYAIDTNALVLNNFRPLDDQAAWLDEEMAKSDARWKIVFGHHPYISNGEHGNSHDEGVVDLIEGHVCGKATVYFAGHDHNREWLEPTCGTNFIVSGAAGRGIRAMTGEEQPTRWQDGTEHGFLWVEIAGDTLTGVFYDADGNADYEDTITL
jgi:tartrate-resistant acid phosphatase type 5